VVYVYSWSARWDRETEKKKPTKTVAKAEGKTAAKAKKRVAARIIEASNESEGEREWVETVKTAGRKETKVGDEERRGKGTTSGDVPFYISSTKPGTCQIPKYSRLFSFIRLRQTPFERHGLAFAPCASKIP